MQQHSITGKITFISEPKLKEQHNGRVLVMRHFKLLQHTDNAKEVPRTFNIMDKYQAAITGFEVGDDVRVFFNMSTINNERGYETTFFNCSKIEHTDYVPSKPFNTHMPSIETTEGFNARNNTPR